MSLIFSNNSNTLWFDFVQISIRNDSAQPHAPS